MKSTLLTLTVFASLIATLILKSQSPTQDFDPLGEAAAEDLPRLIRVHTEFIEMPHETYTKLMSKPGTSSNDTALRAECAKLVATGEAHVLESLCVVATPGQTATTESIAEYIYPTEYDPGEVPNKVNGKPPGPDTQWGSPPNPTSFETRNTGSTFEVEAQIDVNDPIIELRFTPTLVYLADTINWGADKHSGAAGPVLMPQFYVLSVETGVAVVDGQPLMIGALSPQNDKGFIDTSRKVMVFTRADILTVGR